MEFLLGLLLLGLIVGLFVRKEILLSGGQGMNHIDLQLFICNLFLFITTKLTL